MEKIIELRKQGLNSLEISQQLELDKREVDLTLLRFGYNASKRTPTISLSVYEQIIENRYNNIPISQSCKSFGISDAVVSKKFKSYGIYFRRIGDFDYSVWTEEQIKNLITDFNSGIPVYKLVEKYGFNKDALAKIINANGGNTTPISFDNHYFDKINREDKAYWLGFLYADGAISSNNSDVELSLQLLDAEHLNKFKSVLNSSNNVRLDFKVKRCRFVVSNLEFKESLCKLGCTPRKSLSIKFDDDIIENKELYIPFIRGYFDGDGCLTHQYSDEKHERFTISTSFLGTRTFLEWIESVLLEHDIKCTWYHDKRVHENIWCLQLNKSNSIKLLNLLYGNANVYLTRKYEKYRFFANNENFAVYVSDYIEYDRAISEKAKFWIKENLCEDFDLKYANAEITKKSKDFLES